MLQYGCIRHEKVPNTWADAVLEPKPASITNVRNARRKVRVITTSKGANRTIRAEGPDMVARGGPEFPQG